MTRPSSLSIFFFFNDTATTEIYTLSLHDALPIYSRQRSGHIHQPFERLSASVLFLKFAAILIRIGIDRKSTRLNSSHDQISYAVFCLKKKKNYKKRKDRQCE